jgi:hypothetical protein
MLYSQIVAAIGRVVGPVDFQQYVRFHMRKLYRDEYQPLPFSYAVRRPGYTPEGTVSIEAQMDDGSVADPIFTVSSGTRAVRPMSFSIDASTKVRFLGDRFVHGWLNQQFSGTSGLTLQLVSGREEERRSVVGVCECGVRSGHTASRFVAAQLSSAVVPDLCL